MIWIDTGPPLAEPLTLAEAKAHLRIERDDEDETIAAFVRAARETIEARTGLVLGRRSFRICLEGPVANPLRLTRRPVTAVLAVRVFDEAGEPREVDPAAVRIVADGAGGMLRLPEAVASGAGQEIEIELEMGLDGQGVPAMLRLAMLHLVVVSYEMRGAAPASMQPAFLPPLVRGLLTPYRRVGL